MDGKTKGMILFIACVALYIVGFALVVNGICNLMGVKFRPGYVPAAMLWFYLEWFHIRVSNWMDSGNKKDGANEKKE